MGDVGGVLGVGFGFGAETHIPRLRILSAPKQLRMLLFLMCFLLRNDALVDEVLLTLDLVDVESEEREGIEVTCKFVVAVSTLNVCFAHRKAAVWLHFHEFHFVVTHHHLLILLFFSHLQLHRY